MAFLGVTQSFATAPTDACRAIPQDTPVEIEVVDAIDSRTARIGDRFDIRVAAPLVIDGKTLVPTGTTGIGEVIDAQHATFMSNRPGELLVVARYLNFDGIRLPLHGFRIGRTGDKVAVGHPSWIAIAQNTSIPAGSKATAKTVGGCISSPSTSGPQEIPK